MTGLLSGRLLGQEPAAPWRQDPLFRRLATALDPVPAIDMHTHLLQPGTFNPELAKRAPLMNRVTNPGYPALLRERFGVTADSDNWLATIDAIASARAAMVKRLGQQGYWTDHLDYTLTDIALVNQSSRQGVDGKRLRWVPHATPLLFPLRADRLMERSPVHKTDIDESQGDLRGFLKEAGLGRPPDDLPAYVRFLDETLRLWQREGAVGIKFWDAYLRTLRIADVPATQAAALYAKGRAAPLPRDEYLALQDYLWRHILLEAGRSNFRSTSIRPSAYHRS